MYQAPLCALRQFTLQEQLDLTWEQATMSTTMLFLMAALGVATIAHALQPVAVTHGMKRSPIHADSIHICECCEAKPPLQCVK